MIGGGFGGSWPGRQRGGKGKPPSAAAKIIHKAAPAKTGPQAGKPSLIRRGRRSGPAIRIEAAAPRALHAAPAPSGRPPVAVVGRFSAWSWGQHPDEAYLADAIEAAGVPVVRVDQDGPAAPVHSAQWALFTSHPGSNEKMRLWTATHRTILWTLDLLPHFPDRAPVIAAARAATLFASSDRYDWASKGIRNHFYLPAACEDVFAAFDPRPAVKCAFVGSLYSERRKRIAQVVASMGGVVLGRPGEWKYGRDLSTFVQSVKVMVGDNAWNDVDGYWSSRNYVIPGAGGFLLTPSVPGIEEQFEPGRHLAVYAPEDDLGTVIERWASADEERERVRRAGFYHVRKSHTWRARALSLLERMAEAGAPAQ